MKYRARAPLRIDFGGGWTDVPAYAESQGGAVLNAAINQYVEGFISRPSSADVLPALRSDRSSVGYSVDLPPGAGLGGSAAQTVLWVTLVRTSLANTADRAEIAEMACRVGAALGILGGKQDEYAAALGGIRYYTFDHDVRAESLDLPPPLRDELRSRLVLVYSGRSRLSGSIHEHVWGRYAARERSVVQALDSLKRLAADMRDALRARDLDSFGDLLNDNWRNQKALHQSVTSPDLDEIFDLASRHGARGGKACGAGGGGCLVFLSGEGGRERLELAFRQRRLRIIDFDFDDRGVYLFKG